MYGPWTGQGPPQTEYRGDYIAHGATAYIHRYSIAHLFNPPLNVQVKISLLVFHNAENIVWAWPAGADTPLSPAQHHNRQTGLNTTIASY